MKYLFSIITILSIGLLFSGCETDQNGRMPDDIKDANTGVFIVKKADSDPFINLASPGAYKIEGTVDLLFDGTFNKIDVVIVYNNDYTKQYVLKTVTAVPTDVVITAADIVAAIPALTSVADIKEGDVFNVFTNIELSDGTYLPGYTIKGNIAIAPGLRNIMQTEKGGAANVVINVPCPFDLNHYLGVMNASEFWAPDLAEYQVEVVVDPDYVGSFVGLIIKGLWDGTWNLKVELSTYDYTVVAKPASQVMAASVFGYSTPTWSNITGNVETCKQELTVNIGRFCVTVGCFGGMPIVYKMKKAPAAKKLADIQIPYKAPRTVE